MTTHKRCSPRHTQDKYTHKYKTDRSISFASYKNSTKTCTRQVNGANNQHRTSLVDKCVVNLSYRVLNQHEEEVLALGLNFALTQANIHITDIIAQVEQGLSKAEPDNPNRIRTIVRQILQRCEKRQPPNLKGQNLLL